MNTNEYRKAQFKRVKTIYSETKTKIKLIKQDKETLLQWSTEIDPPEFADAIRAGMIASLDQLQEII